MPVRALVGVALFASLAAGCSCSGGAPGSACAADGECRAGLRCVPAVQGPRRCMEPCDEATRLCDDGSVCLASPADGRLCWFGGRTPIHAPCSDPLQCEPGTVCVERMGALRCEQACRVGDDRPCDDGEICAPLEGSSTDGACLAAPPEGSPDAGLDAALTTP